MKNLKYVAKVEGSSADILVDEINFFINNILPNEYIIEVKIVKVGEDEFPGDYSNCKNIDCDLIALLFIGEK